VRPASRAPPRVRANHRRAETRARSRARRQNRLWTHSYDKLWDEHVIRTEEDGTALLYIDRHLVHEVTSPQAFEGLDLAGRKVWRISANLAVSDHNVPTTDRSAGIADPVSRLQVETLDANCDRFGITQFKMNDRRQGSCT
jgi:3-isopropylmalate/(R)-2-methylmalate dehydratase large subunit